MNAQQEFDVAVVGGGVIGLSISLRLSDEGYSVAIVERGEFGKEASWAGAGILPPSYVEHATHPIEWLAARSFQLHHELAERMRQEVNIDNEFQKCGALFIARKPGEWASLIAQQHDWLDQGIAVVDGKDADLTKLAPHLGAQNGQVLGAYYVPEETQIRNPRHSQGLMELCKNNGVELIPNADVIRMNVGENRVNSLQLENTSIKANHFCIATGAWSSQLLESIGVEISVLPVRGQILLYELDSPPVSAIIYEGDRYVVARRDGCVLVGSTVEHAGFDKSNTEEAVSSLKQFASSVDPGLDDDHLVKQWAGLRPGTFDGFPYLGKVPGFENAFAACGHFRTGLLMAPGTAEIMADIISEREPPIDISPFRLDRK